ncbi:glycosyltransferase [Mucilaginibacter sp. CAU 1740]|uniref:glycosyltransferase n=1 Tax=Mucilaginibacter sp. CAU 1740 TaxID=3140365 RepID=UPI00325A7721
MKMVFICSSLEPGRDGVGDYVRRLACELIANNHRVIAIALQDSFLTDIKNEEQEFNGIKLPVLRIPAQQSTAYRYGYLQTRLKFFKPNFISLQYVGFGFNKYGLPVDMLLNLRKATGEVKLHIMLHELWCGMAASAGYKEKVLGLSQKVFLKMLIANLKPHAIFTSVEPYRLYLKQIGVKASVIPIFGNIPTTDTGSEKDWQKLIETVNLSAIIHCPQNWLVLGFFGTTYNCPGLETMINQANNAAKQAGLKLGILAIGNSRGVDVAELIKTLDGVVYWQTGPLSAGTLNRVLQLADIGVVTSPVDGINKSGAAVAWMERGIPVIISAADKTYHEDEMIGLGVYQAHSANEVLKAYKAKGKIKPQNNLTKAAIAYTMDAV